MSIRDIKEAMDAGHRAGVERTLKNMAQGKETSTWEAARVGAAAGLKKQAPKTLAKLARLLIR
ncbi:hypothetical protein E3C22_24125 [Jiella endophytica]|uniref:Uncharacterized protein n=1 Tax=Jiella endophytica TaxID=2558362 RepID=A0A4Y8R6J7_9HYPH|nr:hypothetical protein [Jiella endophytica]TFF17222.1 hypothetical protein E3C22_24125 [Jiella endophytica]